MTSIEAEQYQVPLEQQYLLIKGAVDPSLYGTVLNGADSMVMANRVGVFVSFSYDDIPVGTTFDLVFRRTHPEEFVECSVVIEFITQQFDKKWDVIPRGWKTICVLHFPEGIPQIVLDLPVAKDWYLTDRERQVGICKLAAYASVREFVAKLASSSLREQPGIEGN